MKYQFFKIPTNRSETAQEDLNKFCSSHFIFSEEKNFVTDGQNSYWAFCFTYKDKNSVPTNSTIKTRIDYREVLSENDFIQFSQLRDLRKQLSEQEGIPPYAIFTNEQLATIVTEKINTLNAMQKISGVGPAKLEKYGEAFLLRLNEIRGKTNT